MQSTPTSAQPKIFETQPSANLTPSTLFQYGSSHSQHDLDLSRRFGEGGSVWNPTGTQDGRDDGNGEARKRLQPWIQHASRISVNSVLGLPSETLTHITAYLDPQDLFALSLVNRQLHAHIADDATWRKAALYHFLDIHPEAQHHGRVGDGDGEKDHKLFLRRIEPTWRKEFLHRHRLMSLWKNSRATSTAHLPLRGQISSVHLLPDRVSLMSASVQVGIVTRSLPFTGKTFKGHLDSSNGQLAALGLQTPVSAIALSSDGGTGKVAWGHLSGEVAVTIASRIMDSARGHPRLLRCRVNDEHLDAVSHILWSTSAGSTSSAGTGPSHSHTHPHHTHHPHHSTNSNQFITGGADGAVKMWEMSGSSLNCLWTSPAVEPVSSDPVVKIAWDVPSGTLSAGYRSGMVIVWAWDENRLTETRVPPPPVDDPRQEREKIHQPPAFLMIQAPGTTAKQVSVLVHHQNDTHFWRLDVDLESGTSRRVRYHRGPLGNITALQSDLASRYNPPTIGTPATTTTPVPHLDSHAVFAGDSIGRVSVWPWNRVMDENEENVGSVRRWEAHEHGVTVIERTLTVVATGSMSGTVRIWDAVGFNLLRQVAAPVPKHLTTLDVSQIVVEREFVLFTIGAFVIAWHATEGYSGKDNWKEKLRAGTSSRGRVSEAAKWRQRMEMKKDLVESRAELDEEKKVRDKIVKREKAQRATLGELGLDESEALEYALMLSRDEAEDRERAAIMLAAEADEADAMACRAEGTMIHQDEVDEAARGMDGRSLDSWSDSDSVAFRSDSTPSVIDSSWGSPTTSRRADALPSSPPNVGPNASTSVSPPVGSTSSASPPARQQASGASPRSNSSFTSLSPPSAMDMDAFPSMSPSQSPSRQRTGGGKKPPTQSGKAVLASSVKKAPLTPSANIGRVPANGTVTLGENTPLASPRTNTTPPASSPAKSPAIEGWSSIVRSSPGPKTSSTPALVSSSSPSKAGPLLLSTSLARHQSTQGVAAARNSPGSVRHSPPAARRATATFALTDMSEEEQLRLAMELSLAEAQSQASPE